MAKISVVVLAGKEAHSDMARVLNALELVKEAAGAGDEVEMVFDGAGVQWVPILSDPEHKLHGAYEQVRTHVAGACEFCSNAFEVGDEVREAGVAFLSEFEGHPSLRQRIADGYSVVTF
jgi:hypothetical protein